jgi:hypothetical protein
MKKYFMAACLMAAGLLSLTSCGEKDNIATLTAHFETATAGAKGHLEGAKPMLVSGDSAYVNDGVFGFEFENGDPILKVNHASDNVYRAIFPASIVDVEANSDIAHLNNVRVIIPSVQVYKTENGVQKVDMPMISYPDGYMLWFKNICSIVRVNVTNETSAPVTLTDILMLNNEAGQSGSGSVYLAGSTHVSVPTSTNLPVTTVDPLNTNRSVRLNFNGHPDATIAVGATATYSLVVAPFTGASGMTILLNTASYSKAIEGLENVTELERSTIADVHWTLR